MGRENAVLRKQLNNIQFLGLKGIKVGDSLAIDTWHFRDWTRETISNFEFVEIPEYKYRIEGKKVDKVFIFSYAHIKREDQFQKFSTVEELFDNKAVLVAQKGKTIRNPYLTLIPFWYMQMEKLNYSSIIKRGICYKLCEALGHAKVMLQMMKRMQEVNKVIFFFDVLSIDNILTQLCNQQGYVTYTLQHGIINGSFDYAEYKCSHAKYFLAWGEYTKRVAMRYGMAASKVKVVGSINELSKKVEDEKMQPEKNNCFLVCTNGVINRNAWSRNREIIILANQFAERHNMKYYLKTHPYDNANRYRRIVDFKYCEKIISKTEIIFDMLNKVEFTLCGNSTAFCDSVYWGVPAFRYITLQDRKLDVCKGIKFGKIESLSDLEYAILKVKEASREYNKDFFKLKNLLFEEENVLERYIKAIS